MAEPQLVRGDVRRQADDVVIAKGGIGIHNGVIALPALHEVGVVALATNEGVGTGGTEQDVVTPVADQGVVQTVTGAVDVFIPQLQGLSGVDGGASENGI